MDWKKDLLAVLAQDLTQELGRDPGVTLDHLNRALIDLDIIDVWQAWGRGAEILVEIKSQLTRD